MKNDDSLIYSNYQANSKPIHQRYYSTLLPEHISYNSVFDLLGSSKMDVWRAVSRQAYADSPSLSTLLQAFNPQDIIDPELQDIAKTMRNPTSIKMLFQLLSGSIGLGYLSINAKRLVQGEEWLDPHEEGIFMASLLQGGGLGLFGDFFFNEYDSHNNLLKALAGTMGSDIIDFCTIVTLIKNGELDKAEELLKKSLQKNIPGRNLFYLQPALCGFHFLESLAPL